MYQIALFVHILGVLCLMGGHTLIHASLEVMRHAQQVEQVREKSSPFLNTYRNTQFLRCAAVFCKVDFP